MYYYLSKTLGVLLVPSNLLPIVVICGLLLWRSRYAWIGRRITATGIILLLIAGAMPLGSALLVPLENRFPQWDPARGAPDGIIVLGGIINEYISWRRHDISLDQSAERLTAAINLSRRYPAARILFCGGNASLFGGMPESTLAVRFLEQFGVPDDRILVDDTSRNTMENALNAKKIVAAKPGERWLLVTSAFHMPRAIGLFRQAGFPVEAYPVDWKTGGWRDLRGVPSSLLYGYSRLDLATHEWEGLFVDWISGRSSTLFPGPSK